MDGATLIAAILRGPGRGVFVCAGGGSRLISDILCTPGASRTVLEAVVPYSSRALTEFLHSEPEQCCSEPTARRMAVAAWQRAGKYAENVDSADLFGFSCTASLAAEKPHRGRHRLFLAFHSLAKTLSLSLFLENGARARREEETLAADISLWFLAHALGVPSSADFPETWRAEHLHPAETVSVREFCAPPSWQRLFASQIPAVCLRLPSRQEISPPPKISALLPGSFAPFHAGHAHMKQVAEKHLGTEVALELAIRNADKPPLDYLEIDARLAKIAEETAGENQPFLIYITNLPLFHQKGTIFPHTTFVVGTDTISRIADPVYCRRNGEDFLSRELHFLAEQGDRFLVLGRLIDGNFKTLEELELPTELRNISYGLSETEFREDISSTAIREKNGQIKE